MILFIFLKNRYFKILVHHRAIEYMKKAEHEPTTKGLTVLLLKLQDFQFDLKYMQGPKMHVSDVLVDCIMKKITKLWI